MTTSRYSEIPCLSGIGQFEIHFSWGMSATVAFISFAHLGTAVAGRTTFQTRESNSASPPGTDLRNMVLCCNCKKASSHIQVVACGIAPPSLHTESGKILLSHVFSVYAICLFRRTDLRLYNFWLSETWEWMLQVSIFF